MGNLQSGGGLIARHAKIATVFAVLFGSSSGILGNLITAPSLAIGFWRLTIALPFISEHPMMIVALAPGGFFIYACAIAVVNKILTSKGKKPREFSCQGCALASICQQEKCIKELDKLEKGAEN